MGQMTGRSVGFCTGSEKTGYENPQIGRGIEIVFRGGRGFAAGGRGWRNCFLATGQPGWARFGGYGAAGFPASALRPEPEMEKQALKAQADALEAELEMIKQRLGALEESE